MSDAYLQQLLDEIQRQLEFVSRLISGYAATG
jgi:hypothetical protein